MEIALGSRQIRVQPVTEFVGQGGHVATAARPIQQDIWVMRGDRVRTERAWALGGTHGSIDPLLVEEAFRNRGQLR